MVSYGSEIVCHSPQKQALTVTCDRESLWL